MLKKCTHCGWPITYKLGCPKCGHQEKEEEDVYFGGAGYDFLLGDD
jgi:predicted nucleic-acid-binding Zn-ribbon protein